MEDKMRILVLSVILILTTPAVSYSLKATVKDSFVSDESIQFATFNPIDENYVLTSSGLYDSASRKYTPISDKVPLGWAGKNILVMVSANDYQLLSVEDMEASTGLMTMAQIEFEKYSKDEKSYKLSFNIDKGISGKIPNRSIIVEHITPTIYAYPHQDDLNKASNVYDVNDEVVYSAGEDIITELKPSKDSYKLLLRLGRSGRAIVYNTLDGKTYELPKEYTYHWMPDGINLLATKWINVENTDSCKQHDMYVYNLVESKQYKIKSPEILDNKCFKIQDIAKNGYVLLSTTDSSHKLYIIEIDWKQ